jgi:chemotaxis protein CheZ
MRNGTSNKVFSAERRMRSLGISAAAPAHVQANGASSPDDMSAALARLCEEVAELRRCVAALEPARPATDDDVGRDVKIEIAQMVRMIGRAKTEIAAIKHPKSDDDRIQSASSELDAIVASTEAATEDILGAAEEIELRNRTLSGRLVEDPEGQALTDEIAELVIKILESCNFQDLTGQRINKVVKTLRFIEERIIAMIGIWGVDAFADLPMQEESREGESALLNGPQSGNQGISQADIDKLFA